MGRAGGDRRRLLPRPDRLPVRALALLPRQAGRGGVRVGGRGRRPRGHRPAAADREGRAQGHHDAGQPRRCAPVRRACRDRAHLLHERHDGHAQLHPADGERSRQLGDRLGAQLRDLRRRGRRAHRLDLQRRPIRRGRGTGRLRSHRAVPHPGRHGQQRAADAGDRPAAARGGRAHAVLRGLPRRVGGRARLRPAGLERPARARRGRAGRRRAGLPRPARGGLGRPRHRGHGHRRHRPVAVGRVRAPGRHAPRRAWLRARRADRPRDRRRHRRSGTVRPASSCSRTSATAPRRCCASAPAITCSCAPTRAAAAAPVLACAASGAPTTC